MKSQECYEAIRRHLDVNDSVLREEYRVRKDMTDAELNEEKTPKCVSHIGQLVYDESTRRLCWPTFEDYRDERLAKIDANKKPWKRFGKKQDSDGTYVREFMIREIWDHMAFIREDGTNVIDIWFVKY